MFTLLASPYRSYYVSRDDPLLQSFFEVNNGDIVYVDDAALQQWNDFLILREWMRLPLTIFDSDELFKELRGDTFGKIEEYEVSLRNEKCTDERMKEYVEKYTSLVRSNPFDYTNLPTNYKLPRREVTLAEVGRIATILMLPSTWMYFVIVDNKSSLYERKNFYKKLGAMLRMNSISIFSQHIKRKYFSNDHYVHHNLGVWNDPAYVGSGLFFNSEEVVRKTDRLNIIRGILHSSLILLLAEGRWSENRGEIPIDVIRWEEVALFAGSTSGWIRYLAGTNPTYSYHHPLIHLSTIRRMKMRMVWLLYRAIEGVPDRMKALDQKTLKRIEVEQSVTLNKVLPYIYHHLLDKKRRDIIDKFLGL